MFLPILILIVVVAFALILIVMVQNPKGGGLSSTFGGNVNTIGGVQNTNTFLDRATWILAAALFTLILVSRFTIETKEGGVEIDTEISNTTTPSKKVEATKVVTEEATTEKKVEAVKVVTEEVTTENTVEKK